MVVSSLALLTKKSSVRLYESGLSAIRSVVSFVKFMGKSKVLVQDQGGWLAYRSFARKQGLIVLEVMSDYGVLNVSDLLRKADSNSVLIINSLTGFFAEQPMKDVLKVCADKNCLVFSDVTGAIGSNLAFFGDIVFGSFGRNTAVNAGYGGFVACNDEMISKFSVSDYDVKKDVLVKKSMQSLSARREFLLSESSKIKNDLRAFEIIHRDSVGFNVVVKFKNIDEKNAILDYCSGKYEWLLCPRKIRVDENAISVEVKQL